MPGCGGWTGGSCPGSDMAPSDGHALVLVTCGSEDEARRIARSLVEHHLAAGVQIVPIESVYEWQEEIVSDSEWLLIAKTRTERFDHIEEAVVEMHSYDVPPVLMVEMSQGGGPYLDWIDGLTRS